MTSQNGPQYFSNINNAVLINPSVTHISGNVYNNNDSERYGLRLLLANISTGASHDAAERGDPPRCHPHTRTAIRAEIMEWIQAPTAMRKLILWMYGPAGSGKTSIAQSVAEECKTQGLLAASFFFGRTAVGRNDTTSFVATIAYQLSQSVPDTFEHIISAVEKDTTIFSRTLATQMRVLVIEPLKSLPPSSRPIFVITDGVDECGPSRESHTTLLNTLATAISELRYIPLLLLMASRPEYEIREAFNGTLLSPLVMSLVLGDNYQPDNDIRLYLNSKFQEIRHKHDRLGSRLPSPWPTESDVDLLVRKASGQFIFASTIVKFTDSPRYRPSERLDIILGLLAPTNETPFAQLDALYHFILSSVADLRKVLEILTFIILGNTSLGLAVRVGVTEAFLGFAIGPVLVDMHALVFVPSNHYTELGLHHASLYDFLTDRSRSHEYYIDITQGHILFSRRWLKIMADYPHLPAPLSLLDCVNAFVICYREITTTGGELADDLASFSLKPLLDELRSYKDLYQLPWDDFFACTEKQGGVRVDVFPRLRDEFDAFVLERLAQYPPALRTLIPTIIVYSHRYPADLVEGEMIQDIFRLSFHTLNPSDKEMANSLRLDWTLLHLYTVTR
ncbi:hypothetical protein BJ912DRAFT_988889 [Pholiota molesta]|nr:hypothetical protein BJ912DRAFT_988889 [Pholiota molesta]